MTLNYASIEGGRVWIVEGAMLRFAGAALAMVMVFVPSMASSTIMRASISGDWNDHPFWNSWFVELLYDTSKLVNIEGGIYRGSEALISASGYFEGYCHEQSYGYCDPQVDLPRTVQFFEKSFSFFEVSIYDWYDPEVDLMTFAFVSANAAATMVPFVPKGTTIDAEVNYDSYGEYGSAGVRGEYMGDIHAHQIVVSKAPLPGQGPIPEPAAWALMIAGFGLTGATLRRRLALA